MEVQAAPRHFEIDAFGSLLSRRPGPAAISWYGQKREI